MSQQNVDTIRALYAAFAKGDVTTVLSAFAPDAEWKEADNFIYADGKSYVGPGAIFAGCLHAPGHRMGRFHRQAGASS